MIVRFALAQTPSCGDAQKNVDALLPYCLQAKAEGCAAVCFPEACLTGYAPERAAGLALRTDSPLLHRVSALAQSLDIDLMAGYMENAGDALFITHSLFRADGRRFDYRKTHLGEKEARTFAAGDSLDVFTLSCGLKAGFQLCVESHFPQITQTLSLKGAQIVFAPHAVPTAPQKRQALWQTLIPARAYDNRVYVACCNAWDGARFHGGCYAANPRGEVILSRFEPQPLLALFDAECELPDAYRSGSGDIRARYYPDRRRPELYL